MMDNVWYDMGVTMFGMFVFLLAYALPSFIAYVRDHKRFKLILLVNILFGFFILPWVWTLLWATSTQTGATNE